MGFNIGGLLFGDKPKLDIQERSTQTKKQRDTLNSLLDMVQGEQPIFSFENIDQLLAGQSGQGGQGGQTGQGAGEAIYTIQPFPGPGATQGTQGNQGTQGDQGQTGQSLIQPTDPRQLSILDSLMTFAQGQQGQGGAQTNIERTPQEFNVEDIAADPNAQQAIAELFGIAGDRGQDTSEVFRKTVQEPLLEMFREEIEPEISRRFAGRFQGGERVEAYNEALDDIFKQLSREKASTVFDEKNRASNRAVQALSLISPLTNQNLQRQATNQQAMLEAMSLGLQEQGLDIEQGFAEGRLGLAEQDNQLESLIAAFEAAGIPRQHAVENIQRILDERMRLLSTMLEGSFGQAKENVGAALPGRTGAVQAILSGLAGGVGESIGKTGKLPF